MFDNVLPIPGFVVCIQIAVTSQRQEEGSTKGKQDDTENDTKLYKVIGQDPRQNLGIRTGLSAKYKHL